MSEDISIEIVDEDININVTEEVININISEEGQQGLSAYLVAVQNGFLGTEAEWLLAGQPELQKTATHVQWKLKGSDEWINIVQLSDLTVYPLFYVDENMNLIATTLAENNTDFSLSNNNELILSI